MHVEVTQESKSASMLAWSKKNTMRYEFAIWSVAPDTTSTTTTSTTSSAGISGGSIARMGSSDSSLLNRPQPTLSSSDGIPRGKPLPRAPTSSDAHASSPPISKPLPSPDSRSSSPMPGKSYGTFLRSFTTTLCRANARAKRPMRPHACLSLCSALSSTFGDEGQHERHSAR